VSNWRDNPNLVECFDSCVAMFHGVSRPEPRRSPAGEAVRARRKALGLTQHAVAEAADLKWAAAVSFVEAGKYSPHRDRIIAALGRLEAERAQAAAE